MIRRTSLPALLSLGAALSSGSGFQAWAEERAPVKPARIEANPSTAVPASRSEPVPGVAPLSCPAGTEYSTVKSLNGTIERCQNQLPDSTTVYQGPFRRFHYKSSSPAEAGEYQNGKKQGLWTEWFMTGEKKGEKTYDKDILNGPWKALDQKGNIMAQGVMVKGDGIMMEFYPNGKKQSEGAFKNSRREGRWTSWHPNGSIKVEGEFRNDKKVGRWITYSSQGIPINIESFPEKPESPPDSTRPSQSGR